MIHCIEHTLSLDITRIILKNIKVCKYQNPKEGKILRYDFRYHFQCIKYFNMIHKCTINVKVQLFETPVVYVHANKFTLNIPLINIKRHDLST